MSMQNFPNRQTIDQAEPLEFIDRTPDPSVTIHAQFNNWSIDVTFTGRLDVLPIALAKLERAGLIPRQDTPAAAPAGQKPKRKAIEPIYTPDGTPCCPKHHKPLKQGQFGLYCPSRDDSTERGYCSIRFAE